MEPLLQVTVSELTNALEDQDEKDRNAITGSGLFCSDGFRGGRPGWSKVILHHPLGVVSTSSSLIQEIGGERLREYQAFTLVRIPQPRLQTAISQIASRGIAAEVVESWDTVQTPRMTIEPVTIVLAWTDVPAVAGVASHLVNNLDLKITPNVCTPSGQFMFYGNYISTSTEQSTNICGFGFIQDQSNNVEVVYAPAGSMTSFSMVVDYRNGAAVQPFAIYVKNAL